jgi:hypothetical protein
MNSLVNRAQIVRDRLVTINKTAAELVYENGLLLRELKDNGYYREWGHGSFDECVQAMQDAGLLDYGPRNARHFIRIVYMLEQTATPPTQIGDIGVSKLREIASVPVLEEQRRLLAAAPSLTTAEVQREAKVARDKAYGNESDPLHPITLMTTESMRTLFKDCIAAARQLHSIDDKENDIAAVEAILSDWYTTAIEELRRMESSECICSHDKSEHDFNDQWLPGRCTDEACGCVGFVPFAPVLEAEVA